MRLFQILIHNNINFGLFIHPAFLKLKQLNLTTLEPKCMNISLMIITIGRNLPFLTQEYFLVLIDLHYNFL